MAHVLDLLIYLLYDFNCTLQPGAGVTNAKKLLAKSF